MKKIILISLFIVNVANAAPTATSNGRENFLKQQAYAEMQRVSGQIDVLQSSHDELAERVSRIEGGKGELGTIKSDVASLKVDIESVRREMERMRQEIVADITKKVTAIVKANAAAAPAPAQTPPKQATVIRPNEPVKEYTVQAGDTLSLISQAFSTSVAKLKELNGLKSDRLRVGQKLLVPKN